MFIVIEGIDGAGCETQAINLKKMLVDNQIEIDFLKYPDYERNIGRIIKDFLYQNKNLSAQQQFLLYSLQFLMDGEQIRNSRRDKIVIADRYFSTALCFQTLEGIPLEKAVNFANDFGIEVPDFIFYINVNPDVAITRKAGEDKEKNRREKDFAFIRKTYDQYSSLIKNQVWAKWINIDGERPIDEITKNIYDIIRENLK